MYIGIECDCEWLPYDSFTIVLNDKAELSSINKGNCWKDEIGKHPVNVESKICGMMHQGEFDDYWIADSLLTIPCWNDQSIAVFMSFDPVNDEHFMDDADKALKSFLSKSNTERIKEATLHVYKNCIDYVEDVFAKEDDEYTLLMNMDDEKDVWKFVSPLTSLNIERASEDGGIYISLMCDCLWESEHGLQIVYNNQAKLLRVSE